MTGSEIYGFGGIQDKVDSITNSRYINWLVGTQSTFRRILS